MHNSTLSTANNSAVIDAEELSRRFGLSPRQASAWLQKLPHVRLGRRRFTSEAWLVAWLVANLKNPPRPTNCDPLRADAIEYGAWAIGELVRQGKIRMVSTGGNGEPFGESPTGAGESPALPELVQMSVPVATEGSQ